MVYHPYWTTELVTWRALARVKPSLDHTTLFSTSQDTWANACAAQRYRKRRNKHTIVQTDWLLKTGSPHTDNALCGEIRVSADGNNPYPEQLTPHFVSVSHYVMRCYSMQLNVVTHNSRHKQRRPFIRLDV